VKFAYLCGSCCHANDTHAQPTAAPKTVECAICLGATSLRVERYVVERILRLRLEALLRLRE
jgi:hypothetical protein